MLKVLGFLKTYRNPVIVISCIFLLLVLSSSFYVYNSYYALGWHDTGNTKYYILDSRQKATGFTQIGEYTYLFSSDTNSIKLTGPQTINGNRYNLDNNGALHTGWATSNGNKIYNNQYGYPATSWQTIDGNLYYFNENGIMQTNTVIGLYQLDGNGVATKIPISTSTLSAEVQNILNQIGTCIPSIYNYVKSNLSYRGMDASINDIPSLCVYALNNKRGSCEHFAALPYYMLQQAGYNSMIVTGSVDGTNVHYWVMVNNNGSWRHID